MTSTVYAVLAHNNTQYTVPLAFPREESVPANEVRETACPSVRMAGSRRDIEVHALVRVR